jgi:hypothetical protein
MPGPTVYPDKLRARVHQLYYVQKKPMTKVVPILKKEFPSFAKRITTDRMHSVARAERKKKGLKAKNKNMSEGRSKKGSGVNGTKRKEIIEHARKLRQKNYRWQSIVEELKVKFPGEKIPPAGALSNIVKGRKTKSRNSNKTYHVAITSPNGVVLNIDVSSNKSLEKIIAHILEA